MSRFVTTRLASQLQRRTEGHTYTDSAYYLATPSLSSLDDYGQPTPTTTRVQFSCSFTDKPSVESWKDMDIAELDAEIRFSAFEPDKGGKIVISKRFDADVTEKTFEIIGIQDRGAFGFVCALKAVSL